MNIPFRPSDTDSQEVLAAVTPGTAPGGAGQTAWIDVRGFHFIEFEIVLAAQQNVTVVSARIECQDASGGVKRVPVQDIVPGAPTPQEDYDPTRDMVTNPTPWLLPVPVRGAEMRIDVFGDTAAGTDTVAVRAYRRF